MIELINHRKSLYECERDLLQVGSSPESSQISSIEYMMRLPRPTL
jgi:hypothetical protein